MKGREGGQHAVGGEAFLDDGPAPGADTAVLAAAASGAALALAILAAFAVPAPLLPARVHEGGHRLCARAKALGFKPGSDPGLRAARFLAVAAPGFTCEAGDGLADAGQRGLAGNQAFRKEGSRGQAACLVHGDSQAGKEGIQAWREGGGALLAGFDAEDESGALRRPLDPGLEDGASLEFHVAMGYQDLPTDKDAVEARGFLFEDGNGYGNAGPELGSRTGVYEQRWRPGKTEGPHAVQGPWPAVIRRSGAAGYP